MRFLAGSLLSLAPLSALAGPVVDFRFPDLLSQRDEYVSIREGAAIQLPSRRGASAQAVGPALENLMVVNQTGVNISLGIQILTGSLNGVYNPYPVPTAHQGGFQVSAPAPTPTVPVVQQYYWTVDAMNPAGAKTCVWRVEVIDFSGVCGGTVYYGTYGGALCSIDMDESRIDPITCETRIVTFFH